jgi:hypothetical protein
MRFTPAPAGPGTARVAAVAAPPPRAAQAVTYLGATPGRLAGRGQLTGRNGRRGRAAAVALQRMPAGRPHRAWSPLPGAPDFFPPMHAAAAASRLQVPPWRRPCGGPTAPPAGSRQRGASHPPSLPTPGRRHSHVHHLPSPTATPDGWSPCAAASRRPAVACCGPRRAAQRGSCVCVSLARSGCWSPCAVRTATREMRALIYKSALQFATPASGTRACVSGAHQQHKSPAARRGCRPLPSPSPRGRRCRCPEGSASTHLHDCCTAAVPACCGHAPRAFLRQTANPRRRHTAARARATNAIARALPPAMALNMQMRRAGCSPSVAAKPAKARAPSRAALQGLRAPPSTRSTHAAHLLTPPLRAARRAWRRRRARRPSAACATSWPAGRTIGSPRQLWRPA